MFDFDDNDYSPRSKEPAPSLSTKPAPRVIATLADLDLDRELAAQYAEAVSMRDWILENAEAHNPRDVSDAIKTVNTIIGSIVKMRQEVQNLERMKALEDAVIETMKECPEEVRVAFFARLEEALK